MPTTPLIHPLARVCFIALAVGTLPAGALAAAVEAVHVPVPREFDLAAQTSGVAIWAERCAPHVRPHDRPVVFRGTPAAWAQPQPDPAALAALEKALRHGEFQTSGVRVVETDDGPMLQVAGTHPGGRDHQFRLCNVFLRTSYD